MHRKFQSPPTAPSILPHLLHDDGLDVLGFFQAKRAYNANKRRWDARSPEKAKRPFTPRKNYGRKDPRTSEWYMDYVLDAGKTFRDPTHRDGKLFRNRFFLNFDDVIAIVDSLEKSDTFKWRSHADAFGRQAHPIHLLVLRDYGLGFAKVYNVGAQIMPKLSSVNLNLIILFRISNP